MAHAVWVTALTAVARTLLSWGNVRELREPRRIDEIHELRKVNVIGNQRKDIKYRM
jgi:hypothetical protein